MYKIFSKFKIILLILSLFLLGGAFYILSRDADAAVTQLDDTFGDNGISIIPNPTLNGSFYALSDVAVDSDTYVTTGYIYNGSDVNLGIWRFTEDGSLDTTFNSVGYAEADFADSDFGHKIIVDNNGKYVVVGYISPGANDADMAVWRFNPDGTLDTAFSGDGFASFDLGGTLAGGELAYGLTLDNNGKYVITGFAPDTAGYLDMVIWRLNQDGTLDISFDSDGYVNHDAAAGGGGSDIAYSVIVDSDGKYVASGESTTSGGNSIFAVWRFNDDGSLDTTFDSDGYVSYDDIYVGGHSVGSSIVEQTDGKYLVTGQIADGSGYHDMAVWRLNNDGSLDPTFAIDGYMTHDSPTGAGLDDAGIDIDIQSDGKYLISGSSWDESENDKFVVWRLNNDGSLDTSFNTLGYELFVGLTGYALGAEKAVGALILQDGKYLINGSAQNADGEYELVLIRYENLYQIENLPTGITVTYLDQDIEEGSPNGAYGTVTLRIETDGYVVAEITTDMTTDRDWSIISADVDAGNFASFIHNLVAAEGTGSSFVLFIPYNTGDDSVGICPGADSLEDLNENCTGYVEYTDDSAGVSIVTVDSQQYWRIEGMTDTGGFSFLASAAEGEPLPETGADLYLICFLLISLSLVGVFYSVNHLNQK